MCQDRKVCFISCAAPSLAPPICVASRRSPDRHVAAVSQPPSQPTAARPLAAICFLTCGATSVLSGKVMRTCVKLTVGMCHMRRTATSACNLFI